MDDQLYLRDGEFETNGVIYAEEDRDIVEERAKQDGVLAASYPIMKDVADWFQECISECDSLTNIEMVAQTVNGVKYERTVSIEAQVLAYQLLKQLLEDKKNSWGEFGEGST
jgi:hypothetical protein